MKAKTASAVPAKFSVERRRDGVLLVRVASCTPKGAGLPDAVFTFRVGDPQYEFWAAQWARTQQSGRSCTPAPASSE